MIFDGSRAPLDGARQELQRQQQIPKVTTAAETTAAYRLDVDNCRA